jgi:hypothetical protein
MIQPAVENSLSMTTILRRVARNCKPPAVYYRFLALKNSKNALFSKMKTLSPVFLINSEQPDLSTSIKLNFIMRQIRTRISETQSDERYSVTYDKSNELNFTSCFRSLLRITYCNIF